MLQMGGWISSIYIVINDFEIAPHILQPFSAIDNNIE
jgi:hypothetical protein